MGRRKLGLGRRKLGFGGLASTAAVRTRGDFGIFPSPYDADFKRKTRSQSAAKVYERSMRESLACKLFLELESFATRCEQRVSQHDAKLSCLVIEKDV